MKIEEALLENNNKEISKCVVKLTTNMWSDTKGIYIKKSIIFLKRKCKGFNVFYEDIVTDVAENIIKKIVNLMECEDGVYTVVICNKMMDFETENLEDYDFKLIPND